LIRVSTIYQIKSSIIMAKLAMGILGGFRGKVGTVVGSFWKGVATIRAYVANVTQPNSPAQLEQRAKFSAVIHFLQPLTAFIRVGFKSLAVKMTEINAAVAYNLENAVTGIYPAFTIDYPNAMVSRGHLAGVLNAAAGTTVPGEIEFTWDNNSGIDGSLPEDKVMLVVYNPTKDHAITVLGGNTRLSGSQAVPVPASFAGDEVKCYISFQDAKQTVVSDSAFAGSVVV
jgi:hypothetical protein